MARQLRPYFPGAGFHITARTQGGAPWFDPPMRDFICEALAAVQRRCDVKLFAFVIMPNHLHLVVQQGDYPLDRFMQPLLTRVAMRVQLKYELLGHVFGRRYWCHPCLTTDYLQTCIAYVHRNPVRAALCAIAEEYKWSSAGFYAGGENPAAVVVEPPTPVAEHPYTTALRAARHDLVDFQPTRKIEHIVAQTIRRFAADIDVDLLRALRGTVAARIRRECIREAVRAGYRNVQIAKFLCVSESIVSREATAIRGNGRLGTAFQDESDMAAE